MNKKLLPAPPRQDDGLGALSSPLARISDRLASPLLEDDAFGPRDSKGRLVRSDGWTPDRIRTFLHSLASCGVVADAVRAAGMSRGSAYAFRQRPEGRPFAIGWDAAELHGHRRLADEVMSRALNGVVELIVRDGKVCGERHRFCPTTSLSVLRRLDQKRLARDSDNVSARLAAQEFAEFVEIVANGGEGAEAFLLSRSDEEGNLAPRREVGLLARLAAYRRRLLGKA